MSSDTTTTGSAPRRHVAGPMTRREARLAYGMLFPTLFIVAAIVLLPLVTTFWISVKPVQLTDLRAPETIVRDRVRGDWEQAGDVAEVQYRARNSSPEQPITGAGFSHTLPAGLTILEIDERCVVSGQSIDCELGDWEGGTRDEVSAQVEADQAYIDDPVDIGDIEIVTRGNSTNVLTSGEFTFENFTEIFSGREFVSTLWITFAYTIFGTIGALVMGLFAAQLLAVAFPGRSLLRGLFLFPYVAPVIAMAFAWIILLDPNSGALNALLIQMGVITEPISFFGIRSVPIGTIFGYEIGFPLALSMVIAFEAWRYFPLSFLFILARMQSIPTDMYEAAEMDGATPLQQFWELSLPQLFGILAVIFLLRFIWTFNKFDDIFLLTGGNAGTRTLTVQVYEQGFALNNLGAGAAVAVIVFVLLFSFAMLYFRSMPKEEGL